MILMMMMINNVCKKFFFLNISFISDLLEEKRAILNFLQKDEDASEFLDQSRRLFGGTKSQMKEAKEK